MVIEKNLMASAIKKVKSVIPKKSTMPALEGALVNDGYLIATNTEIAVQVKLDEGKGEKFILPSKALDMICNMPEGDIRIECDEKMMVTLQSGKIKNRVVTVPASGFTFDDIRDVSEENATVNGKAFMQALSRVSFVADAKSTNSLMRGVYFEGKEDEIVMVAIDGHRIARTSIEAEGVEGMKLLVPKEACNMLVALGMEGDMLVSYNSYAAIFKSDNCVVYTRLISGQYFEYEQMFGRGEVAVSADRRSLSDALTRANMCITGENAKIPVIFEISECDLGVSVFSGSNDYHEVIGLPERAASPIRMGFNPRLISDALKYFMDDEVGLEFTAPKMPFYISEECSNLRILILPVNIPQ